MKQPGLFTHTHLYNQSHFSSIFICKPHTYGVFHHALIILCVQIILRGKKLFFLFVIIIALFTNNFLWPKITCMSHKNLFIFYRFPIFPFMHLLRTAFQHKVGPLITLNSSWHRFIGCWKESLEILFHIDMIPLHSCSRTSMM